MVADVPVTKVPPLLNAPILSAFALALVAPGVSVSKEIVVADDGRVERYFGVPVSIDIESVDNLKLKHRRSSLYTGEGMTSRTAVFSGRGGVELVVVFDRRGKMLAIQTESPRAVDQRGVRIGTSLAKVQALWPCGKLYYGNSIEGGHRYATFLTGTNVVFKMSTQSFDQLPKLKVQMIKIVNFSTADAPGMNCQSKAG